MASGRGRAFLRRVIGSAPTWIVPVIITALAAVPRLANLGGPSFWNDEGTTALYAISAMKNGLPTFPSGRSVWFVLGAYEPLYPMIVAQFFRAFGINQFDARLPSALVGIALVPVAFIFGRKLRGEYVGAAFAVVVAFSTEYIAWSRQARAYMLFTFLLLSLALLGWAYVHRKQPRYRTWLVLGIGATGFLVVLTAPGLFLFAYLPGILLGGAAYWILRHYPRVLRFFGLHVPEATPADAVSPGARERWLRRTLLLGILALLALLAFVPAASNAVIDFVFAAIFHATPYPLQFIPFYSSYLIDYYPFILVLAGIGAGFAITQWREFEIALLVVVIANFVALSTLFSLVGATALGGPTYERYLTPQLVFIFYFAAVGFVETVRAILLPVRGLDFSSLRSDPLARQALAAVAVATILVVPAVAVPSTLNLYPSPVFSSADSEVPWVPFSPYPASPSALYNIPSPSFELACDYVSAHRQPSDVVMAVYPDAPAFYLGPIQYWLFVDPPAGSVATLPNGEEVYGLHYLDGPTQLVQTVSGFESILMNSSGWIVGYPGEDLAWQANLTLAVEFLTDSIPSASDVTITLFHWNRSSPQEMLQSILAKRPDLQLALGNNYTALVDWAAISGVTTDGLRPVLLPIESYLVNESSPSIKPLAVLLQVFNDRPDLQTEFPATFHSNFTGLLQWAHEVVTGEISDPAYPVLEPYAASYPEQ